MYYMYRNLIDSLFILIITFDYIRCVMLLFWKEKSCFTLKKQGRKCDIVYKQKLLSVGFSVSECCGAKFDIYVICRTFFPENGSHQRAFCTNTIMPS